MRENVFNKKVFIKSVKDHLKANYRKMARYTECGRQTGSKDSLLHVNGILNGSCTW